MGMLRNDGLADHLLSLNSVIKKKLNASRSARKPAGMETQDLFASPVNNFLKDLDQIDSEIRREVDRDNIQFNRPYSNGNIIPIEQAINGMMEENY